MSVLYLGLLLSVGLMLGIAMVFAQQNGSFRNMLQDALSS